MRGRLSGPRVRIRLISCPLLVVGILAVGAGCDSSNRTAGPQSTTASGSVSTQVHQSGSGFGTYEFSYNGARITIRVPVDRNDPAVARAESFRARVGAPPVTYLLTEVDNTSGKDPVDMYTVTIVTEDGNGIDVDWAFYVIGSWNTDIETPTEDYTFPPGTKGTTVLAASEPIDSVAHLYVHPDSGTDNTMEATRR